MSRKILFATFAGLALLGSAAAAAAVNISDDGVAVDLPWRDHRAAGPGPFSSEGGVVDGKFVSFTVDGGAGALYDYALKRGDASVVVFDAITLSPFEGATDGVRGPTYHAATSSADLVAFNAPNGGFAIRASNATIITLVLGDDNLTAEYHAGEPDWSPEGVLLRYGDATGRLVLKGDENATMTLDGDTITVELSAGSGLVFNKDGHPRAMHAEGHVLHAMMKRGRDGEGPRGDAHESGERGFDAGERRGPPPDGMRRDGPPAGGPRGASDDTGDSSFDA